MIEGRPTDLLYGHVGVPIYDLGTQQWVFPRQHSSVGKLEPVDPAAVVLDAFTKPTENFRQHAVDRARGVTASVREHPTLSPASHLMSNLVRDSETLSLFDHTRNYFKSNLLAFGQAVDRTSKSPEASIPIVAIAAGPAGESLLLISPKKEQLGWGDEESCLIDRLTISGGKQGWWKGSSSPIQQVSAHVDSDGESGTLLAVRSHDAVTILRPSLRKQKFYARSKTRTGGILTTSELEINEVMTIGSLEEEDILVVDVSFNPWNPEQVATIDERGSWSVWGLERVVKRNSAGTAKRIYSDRLSLDAKTSTGDGSMQPPVDRWARVLWMCDPTILLVATRRTISVVSTELELQDIRIPDLSLKHTTDWILDFQRVPQNPDDVFAATTTRIFWLRITVTEEENAYRQAKVNVSVLLSWVHYMDPQDLSLKLEILIPNSNGLINVLLYSRLTSLILAFTFEYRVSVGQAVSLSDPYILYVKKERHLPLAPSPAFRAYGAPLDTVILQPLGYSNRSHEILSDSAQDHQSTRPEFFQITILRSDLSLFEGLYVRSQSDNSKALPVLKVQGSRNGQGDNFSSEADFIVPDGAVHHELVEIKNRLHEQTNTRFEASVGNDDDPRTISLEWLLDNNFPSPVGPSDENTLPSLSPEEAFKKVEAVIQGRDLSERFGLQIALELVNRNISSENLDELDIAMKKLLRIVTEFREKAVSHDTEPIVQEFSIRTHLSTPTTAHFGLDINGSDFRTLYDELVRSHLSSLPHQVQMRARSVLEPIIRSVAAQIFLASQRIRLSPFPLPLDAGELGREARFQSQSNFNLPTRAKAPGSSSGPEKGKGKDAQALDLPASTSSGQIPDGSAKASRTTTPSPAEDPEIQPDLPESAASQRLRRLVSLKPQPDLPLKLSEVLTHWDVGEDPASYDWAAKTRQQLAAADTESEGQSGSSSSQDRKAKRKKRLRESFTGGPSWRDGDGIGGSQPLPPLMTGSQPVDVVGSSQGTATLDSGVLPMSQPVPGRHGARLGREGKKKKRKEGF